MKIKFFNNRKFHRPGFNNGKIYYEKAPDRIESTIHHRIGLFGYFLFFYF